MRRITSVALATALALAVSASPSAANDDTAKAIAGVIALGLLGAAIADDQHNRGHEGYTPQPRSFCRADS